MNHLHNSQTFRSIYNLKKFAGLRPPVGDHFDAGSFINLDMEHLTATSMCLDFFFFGNFIGLTPHETKSRNYLYISLPGEKIKWPFHGPISGNYLLVDKNHHLLSQTSTELIEKKFRLGHLTELNQTEYEKISHLFTGIIHEIESQSHIEFVLGTYFRLFLDLVSHIKATRSTPKTLERTIVSNFRKELALHYSVSQKGDVKLPSVAQIARQLKVTPKYLSEALKERTGKSALEHIHDHVVENAKPLLADPSLTIGEIAMLLGFEYQNYFARLFRKKTGMTPSRYRSKVGAERIKKARQ